MSAIKAKAIEKLTAAQADISNFCQANPVPTIESSADLETVVKIEIEAKKRINRLETLRKFFTKPLNDQVKQINDMFRAEAAPLVAMEALTKSARRNYAIRLDEEARKKRAEELERAKESMDEVTATVESILAVPEPDNTVKTAGGSSGMKKVWTFEVTDEKKLRKYYPQLFVLDEKALRAMITGGKREIAGVRVYQDYQAVTRVL